MSIANKFLTKHISTIILEPAFIKCHAKDRHFNCKLSITVTLWQIAHFYLRNEFNFWKVHGIMNTSGLLQSK